MMRIFRFLLLLLTALAAAARVEAQSTDLAVSFSFPTNGQTATEPLFLLATASESTYTVISVEFFVDGQSIGVVSNTPIIYTSGGGVIITTVGTPPPPSIFYLFPRFTQFWNPQPGNYTLTAQATDSQGNTAMSDPVNVTVIPTPVVSVEATVSLASSNGPGIFTVSRTGDTTTDLSVQIYLSGNAKNGIDYETLSNSVTIPAGQSTIDVPITPLADLAGKTRAVTLSLAGFVIPLVTPTGSPGNLFVPYNPPYLIGSPSEATIYIKADDRNVHKPSVRIMQPRNHQSSPVGSDIAIQVGTFDRDTYVSTVEFFDGTTKLGEAYSPTTMPPGLHVLFEFLWTNAPAGPHVLRARATDSQGARQISGPVRIQVLPGL